MFNNYCENHSCHNAPAARIALRGRSSLYSFDFIYDSDKLMRLGYYLRRIGGFKLGPVAESPKHAYRIQSRVFCGFHIRCGVAYIKALVLCGAEVPHNLKHAARVGFQLYALARAVTQVYQAVTEQRPGDFSRCRIRLVGQYRDFYSPPF